MIIKVSSSGKQLQVVDDDGFVFGTSVTFLKGLLDNKSKFLLLTKMPFKVSKSRYKPSPVYNPVSGEKELELSQLERVDELSTSDDAFSQKVLKQGKVKKGFEEIEVF